MKIMKKIAAVLIALAFAAAMFFCFVSGAPETSPLLYVVMAALLSLSVSAALLICFFYIDYLQRKLEETEADK